ncbi:threonine/serine exporter family protein [Desulfovibrio sulfodismutans]|uniref:Threonine/serine exporter family protein n=1 Tax=Desulfolutivibrio sulfodismutans TaxID=63561 RepID=A0A7K3NJB4_9BACT|nr:threonine/serine exporter family protein [Desulfolutivibrio sulfodismutans]NDY55865.1 threonine/serine exporter family protein [Desulfolutivibrio sulfodismutans]QLA14267.1 hypothetical protein GD606_19340 [Desulfolutivibrio sulfodismutans DSM 3696]
MDDASQTQPDIPREHASLEKALTPAIRAGAIMFASGGEIDKVRRAIASMLRGHSLEHIHILVAHNALMVTVVHHGEVMTQVQSIDGHGVDFNKIAAVYRLAKKAHRGNYPPDALRGKVEAIRRLGRVYPRTLAAACAALACGAFAVIFGGGVAAFLVTALAAFLGAWTRFLLAGMRFNVVLVFGLSSFVATYAALVLSEFLPDRQYAEMAAVLFLIPGVPLIDAFEEIIRGYFTVGLTRAVMGLMMILALSAGMTLALVVKGLW